MITISWYNAVAIAVGLLFLFLLWREERAEDASNFKGLSTAINESMIIVCAVLFYAIWGGIFWW